MGVPRDPGEFADGDCGRAVPCEAVVGASARPVEASQGCPLPVSRGAPWTPAPSGKKPGWAAGTSACERVCARWGQGARCAWVGVRLGVLPILKAPGLSRTVRCPLSTGPGPLFPVVAPGDSARLGGRRRGFPGPPGSADRHRSLAREGPGDDPPSCSECPPEPHPAESRGVTGGHLGAPAAGGLAVSGLSARAPPKKWEPTPSVTSHTSQIKTRSHHPLLQRPLPSLTPSSHLTFGNPEKDNTWSPFSGPFCCRGPRTPSATAPHQPGRPTGKSGGEKCEPSAQGQRGPQWPPQLWGWQCVPSPGQGTGRDLVG